MYRFVYTIESSKGFLQDIEQYTDNILDAVTFTSLDNALKGLRAVHEKLTAECWVGVCVLAFPRPEPAPCLTKVY